MKDGAVKDEVSRDKPPGVYTVFTNNAHKTHATNTALGSVVQYPHDEKKRISPHVYES